MKEEKGYRNQPCPFYFLSWWNGKFKWFGLFVSSKQSLKNECSLIIGQQIWEELRTSSRENMSVLIASAVHFWFILFHQQNWSTFYASIIVHPACIVLSISCLFYLAQPTKFMNTDGFLPTLWKSLVYWITTKSRLVKHWFSRTVLRVLWGHDSNFIRGIPSLEYYLKPYNYNNKF